MIIALILYFLTFYNPKNRDLTYEVLTGEGYDDYHNEMIALISACDKIPYDEVRIKSEDGKTLYAKLYINDPAKPFHIQFHGYLGNAVRDFCGGMQLAFDRGENVVLVDQRSHGKSQGHTVSFGIKERKDVMTWVKFVTDTYGKDTEIWIEGISMGAATVLMASSENYPENVKGIWADCPYSEPLDIIMTVAKEKVFFAGILKPFFLLAARVYGHFNLRETSAAKEATKAKIPIAIIHGTGDRFVPIEMGREIAGANPDIKMTEIEGAPHGLSYFADFDTYKKKFEEFRGL